MAAQSYTIITMKTLRIHLQSLPPYTPPGAAFYLAGDFNDWHPADERARFWQQGDGSYALELPLTVENMACKITRGDWASAEGDARGRERPNRVVKTGATETQLWFGVQSWTDFPAETAHPAAAPNVVLLHPNFSMPQLNRQRRVWAYLPPDYWTSGRRYPVVYMQDGQNLFDNPEALFGSWGIDRAINRLFGQTSDDSFLTPIVVGIEHGGAHRSDEYSPWHNGQHGGGQGMQYLDFVCHALKPFVDERLRTLPEREHTGIMGSSMGGLISLCAALEKPDVFGMAGVFSPSLWFSKEVLNLAKKRRPVFPVKILLMAGQQESRDMVGDLLDLYENLLEAGHEEHNLHYDLHSDGVHSEWFWAREFEHALRWLFGDAPGHEHGGVPDDWFKFRLDEARKEMILRVSPQLAKPLLEIRDYCHDRRWEHPLAAGDNRIPYAVWEECLYSFRIHTGGDLVFSRRAHLNQMEKTKH